MANMVRSNRHSRQGQPANRAELSSHTRVALDKYHRIMAHSAGGACAFVELTYQTVAANDVHHVCDNSIHEQAVDTWLPRDMYAKA